MRSARLILGALVAPARLRSRCPQRSGRVGLEEDRQHHPERLLGQRVQGQGRPERHPRRDRLHQLLQDRQHQELGGHLRRQGRHQQVAEQGHLQGLLDLQVPQEGGLQDHGHQDRVPTSATSTTPVHPDLADPDRRLVLHGDRRLHRHPRRPHGQRHGDGGLDRLSIGETRAGGHHLRLRRRPLRLVRRRGQRRLDQVVLQGHGDQAQVRLQRTSTATATSRSRRSTTRPRLRGPSTRPSRSSWDNGIDSLARVRAIIGSNGTRTYFSDSDGQTVTTYKWKTSSGGTVSVSFDDGGPTPSPGTTGDTEPPSAKRPRPPGLGRCAFVSDVPADTCPGSDKIPRRPSIPVRDDDWSGPTRTSCEERTSSRLSEHRECVCVESGCGPRAGLSGSGGHALLLARSVTDPVGHSLPGVRRWESRGRS